MGNLAKHILPLLFSNSLLLVFQHLIGNDVVVSLTDLCIGATLCVPCISDQILNSFSNRSKRLVDAIDPALVQRIAKPAHNLLVNAKPAREINVQDAGGSHRIMEQKLRRNE